MTEFNRKMIETLVRQIVTEQLMPTKQVDPSGVASIKLPEITVSEEDRLDTGNPNDIVYTKGFVLTRRESSSRVVGLMVNERKQHLTGRSIAMKSTMLFLAN